MITKSYKITGQVQGVMFRQTFIRAALNQKIKAGATNLKNPQEVMITFIASQEKIDEMLRRLLEIRPLNSWGAQVKDIHRQEETYPYEKHQVTTENVDDFNWSSGVEMYL